MLRVKLYGKLADQLPKKYRKSGLLLHANTVREVITALDQLFPFTEQQRFKGSEYRLGRTLKDSRKLKLAEAQHGLLCGLDGTESVTLHIVPAVFGSEITSAMIVTALVTSAISIGVSLIVNALFPVGEKTSNNKRKSALYAGGLNVQQEGVVLPYLAGTALCGSNFIETDVEVMSVGLAPSFTPGPGATKAGASGGLYGSSVKSTGLIDDIFKEVYGSKGGGKTRADNMMSFAKMKMLGAIAAGPVKGIKGTTDAEKMSNIFIDGLPLWNVAENRATYDGVTWAEAPGVEGQGVIAITPGVSNVINENQALVKQTVAGQDGAIIRAVSGPGVARVKIRVAMALLSTSKKGNQNETDMDITVLTRLPGGGWQQYGTWHWHGKSSSAVQSEMIVNAPDGAGDQLWEFKVQRLTADSTDDKLQNETSFGGWTETIDKELSYDGTQGAPPTALFGMAVDNSLFDINQPPEVAEIWDGRLCRVPTSYDPETRTYAEFWDGTWKRAHTDNPVWHWLELATDPVVGGGIADSYFNKWSLLDCAKFCDQLVNGRPRYTLNKQFTDDQPIRELLSDLAKTFRANVFFGGSEILLIQDRPQGYVNHYVNNAMVLNGQFAEDDIEKDARFNEIVVQWDNPAQHYETAEVVYRDEVAIAKLAETGAANGGVISKSVYKIGCTNAQEAFDYARLLVWISQNEYKTITFDMPVGACNFAPGQLMEIDDWNKTGKSKVGTVKRIIDANNIELDAPFDFKGGAVYKLRIANNEGQTIKDIRGFAQDTTSATITVQDHGLIEEQPVGIVQVGAGAQPVVYRVIDIAEKSPGQYSVTGQLYHEGKFAWVEQNVPVVIPPTTEISIKAPKPEGLAVRASHRADDVLGTIFDLEASWFPYQPPAGVNSTPTKVLGYEVQWSGPGDATLRPWERVYTTIYTIKNAEPGQYRVRVRSINTVGATSEYAEVIYDLNSDGDDLEPPIFEGLF